VEVELAGSGEEGVEEGVLVLVAMEVVGAVLLWVEEVEEVVLAILNFLAYLKNWKILPCRTVAQAFFLHY
jgi:hypothetical protein